MSARIKPLDIDEIPRANPGRRHIEDSPMLRDALEHFVKRGVKIGLLEYDEGDYMNLWTAYRAIFGIATNAGLPITARLRGNNVYVVRTDM